MRGSSPEDPPGLAASPPSRLTRSWSQLSCPRIARRTIFRCWCRRLRRRSNLGRTRSSSSTTTATMVPIRPSDFKERGHAVRLILRTDQRGLSSAVLRGFSEAKGRVLVCMDADLSHPPEVLPRMIETLEKDQVEFVIGSRYVRGGTTDGEWSWFRKLNSKVATLMARPFCRASDPLAGYFALPRAVFDACGSVESGRLQNWP